MANISTLGQALQQVELMRDQQVQMSLLSQQLATQKKARTFAGLGTDVLTTQRARAEYNSLDIYINNIKNADRRLKLMVDSVTGFKAQAENFSNYLIGFTQEGANQQGEVVYYDDPGTTAVENVPVGMTSGEPGDDLQNLQDFASNAYDMLVSLLNQKDGDRYLFAGADTLTQPITDTGSLDSALNALFGNWRDGTITTDEFIADLNDRTTDDGNNDAITDTIVGYSSSLSAGTAGDVFVRVDETAEVEYTTLANENPFRDIMVALSYFKSESLGPIVDEVDPDTLAVITQGAPGADMGEMKDNFFAIFENLTAMVNEAIDQLDNVRFRLENARANIRETQDMHKSQQALLLDTISSVEDVNMDEVAVKINQLAIQLDASYRVTARIQQISLVNFL